jgi:hypothetical protein
MKVGDLVRLERPLGGLGHLVGQLGVITKDGPRDRLGSDARVLLTNGEEFWFEASELEVIDESG